MILTTKNRHLADELCDYLQGYSWNGKKFVLLTDYHEDYHGVETIFVLDLLGKLKELLKEYTFKVIEDIKKQNKDFFVKSYKEVIEAAEKEKKDIIVVGLDDYEIDALGFEFIDLDSSLTNAYEAYKGLTDGTINS